MHSRYITCPLALYPLCMAQKHRTLADFPEVLASWDFDKNPRELEPHLLSRVDDQRFPDGFWWLCEFKHSYPMSITYRLKGSTCLVCANKIVPGQNDLFTQYPQLADFWPSSKMWADRPQNLSKSLRDQSLELECKTHPGEFTISIRNLVRFLDVGKSACEKCRSIEKLSGRSVQDKMPDIAVLWDYEKNLLEPSMVSYGTNVRYWWLCLIGHDSWEASPDEVSRGWRMCPCCPGSHKLVPGCNDLGTTHPVIAERWDYSRNSLSPREVKIGMNRNFFFLCNKNPDHHPEMYLPNLKKNPYACTHCWQEPLRCGLNDFGCLFPDLVPYFQGISGNVTPHDVRPGDERVFLWRCLNGEDHTFERTLYNMTSKRSKQTCPVCVNRQIIPGLNSLRDLVPDIAEEWDYEANKRFSGISPETISPRSGHEVYWLCKSGHSSFKAAVWNRTVAETGCPNCANFGFKKSEPAVFYLVERDESELFRAARKVGISNLKSSKTRLRHWSYQGFSTVFTVSHPSGALIADLEKVILEDWIRADLGLGQHLSSDEIVGGFTETFAPNSPTNAEVVEKINQVFAELKSRALQHS